MGKYKPCKNIYKVICGEPVSLQEVIISMLNRKTGMPQILSFIGFQSSHPLLPSQCPRCPRRSKNFSRSCFLDFSCCNLVLQFLSSFSPLFEASFFFPESFLFTVGDLITYLTCKFLRNIFLEICQCGFCGVVCGAVSL